MIYRVKNLIYEPDRPVERETVHLVRFKTRHFTPFYLFGGAAPAAVGGGGGGGCAISPNGHGNVIEYMLPYFLYIAALLIIKLKGARNRKII